MNFEDLDGLIKELHTCEDDWESFLTKNKYLSDLKIWYNQWLSVCGTTDSIPLFKFTKDDINYLNSRFIDSLVPVQGRYSDNAFYALCETGNLVTVQWVYKTWGSQLWEDTEIVYPSNGYNQSYEKKQVFHSKALYHACTTNNLAIAKWIYQTFNDIHDLIHWSHTLTTTIANGHLECMKWLIETFVTTLEDKKTLVSDLVTACKHNRLKIAKYLCSLGIIFTNNIINGSFGGDRLFVSVCIKGYLEMAQFIYDNTMTGPEGSTIIFPHIIDEAFNEACINGHLEVAKWLVTKQPDIFFNSISTVYQQGHIDVFEWLSQLYLERMKQRKRTMLEN